MGRVMDSYFLALTAIVTGTNSRMEVKGFGRIRSKHLLKEMYIPDELLKHDLDGKSSVDIPSCPVFVFVDIIDEKLGGRLYNEFCYCLNKKQVKCIIHVVKAGAFKSRSNARAFLLVRPISLVFGLSLLNELKVPSTNIEEKIVHVGKEEALRLLVASFVCDSVLTNVFIRKPKQNKRPKQEQS